MASSSGAETGCIMKRNMALGAVLVAALAGSLLTGCSSDTATTTTSTSAAVTDHPFSATAAGEALDTTDTNKICTAAATFTVITATGQTADGEKITMTTQHCRVSYGKALNGSGTMTMANGDQIFVTYESDWAVDSATHKVKGTGPFTVVGGTGEFENASGTLAHTCLTSWGGAQPWPVEFTFDGTLTY